MAASGNYFDENDVDNWPIAYVEADKQTVIDRVEERVEKITHDYFYSRAFDEYFDGNGHNRLFLGFKQDILTVTTIKIHGITLSTSYWTYDKDSVYLEPTAAGEAELRWLLKWWGESELFPHGENNVEVIGTLGWDSCPENVKQACIILARYDNDNTLYTRYIAGSETLGGYTYQNKMRVLTGIYEADILLQEYVRHKIVAIAV